MAKAERGTLLSVCAVLFGILGISNLLKPFQLAGEQTGFVLMGMRLEGTLNAIVGPLFGVYLLVFAWAIWNMRRFAMPMSHAYATYVVLNLIMFTFLTPTPDTAGHKIFGLVYAVVAIGVSAATAITLTKRKEDLA